VGIEVDEAAARLAVARTSVPVHVRFGAAGWRDQGTFDLVSMNHYIEHVPQPAEEIQAAAGRLRPGGLFLLRTPNGGSHLPRTFGWLWSWFTPPTHLTYFRRESFEWLAGRMGLSVEAIRIWRGDQYSTPLEVALAILRGLSGERGYSRLTRSRQSREGSRVMTAVKVLDFSPIIRQAFSGVDDCELLVLLRNQRSGA